MDKHDGQKWPDYARKCVVVGCGRSMTVNNANSVMEFYSFPTDQFRCKKWKDALGFKGKPQKLNNQNRTAHKQPRSSVRRHFA